MGEDKKTTRMDDEMYHISYDNLDGFCIDPAIPENPLTRKGYENNEIPRVCFASSINGGLMAFHQNLQNEILYVHEPAHAQLKTISNQTIVQYGYVPDALYTGELWCLEPVVLNHIKTIRVKEMVETIFYGIGTFEAELYSWDWEETENKILAEEISESFF